jgi:VanZ family protein
MPSYKSSVKRSSHREEMKRVLSKPFVRYWAPALIMLVLIRIESTTLFSGTATEHWLVWLSRMMGLHLPVARLDLLNAVLRKAGHCIGYAMLSFLAFRAMRGTFLFVKFGFAGWRSSHAYEPLRQMGLRALWQPWWAVMGFVVAMLTAMADEIHQMHLPGRTGAVHDMVLDSTAALAAQILTYLMARSIVRRRLKAEAPALQTR